MSAGQWMTRRPPPAVCSPPLRQGDVGGATAFCVHPGRNRHTISGRITGRASAAPAGARPCVRGLPAAVRDVPAAGRAAGFAGATGPHDGTATAVPLYLNFASASDAGAARTLTVSGTIVLHWTNLGDY